MSPQQMGRWHRHAGALRRFVADLVADEVRRLRPGADGLPPLPWSDDVLLSEGGLGLDSLERMSVAAALSEAMHADTGVDTFWHDGSTFGGLIAGIAAGLERSSERLTFRTSGSSGRAKPCTHETALLMQEVDHFATLLGGTRRVLRAVPAHHIYGFLFTVALPARLGVDDVIDIRKYTPQGIAALLRPGDLVIGHPLHWQLMARHAGRLPDGVTGMTSTAPCPAALARELTAPATGLARLIQVYGSSETAGIGWRESPDGPYELIPHWTHDSELFRTDAAGIRIAPDLQDHLDWIDSRYFNVRGRIDRAVQVGGVNVFPARVRDVLLTHPAVADAAVRLMNPHEGSRLKAFVVPTDPSSDPAWAVELAQWIESRLSSAERPRSIVVGNALPTDDKGKARDWAIDPAR